MCALGRERLGGILGMPKISKGTFETLSSHFKHGETSTHRRPKHGVGLEILDSGGSAGFTDFFFHAIGGDPDRPRNANPFTPDSVRRCCDWSRGAHPPRVLSGAPRARHGVSTPAFSGILFSPSRNPRAFAAWTGRALTSGSRWDCSRAVGKMRPTLIERRYRR